MITIIVKIESPCDPPELIAEGIEAYLRGTLEQTDIYVSVQEND